MTATQMTFSNHTLAVLKLGLPLVGGHLAQFAIGMTDTIMMGWYGVSELAALTLAGSYFFTIFIFGTGFAGALMPLVATYAAREDETSVRRATRMALWLSFVHFMVFLPAMIFSAPVLQLLGQTEEIAEMAQRYLRIAGFGMLPALGVMVLKSYLAGLEHTRVVLWITVAAAGVNGLVNYALIFGNWGMPELGLEGAALASVLSTLAAMILVTAYALVKLPQHELLRNFWRPDWEMFQHVLRQGLPIGLTILAEVGLFTASAIMMGWLGTVPLAAHGIALQIASATFMAQMGLSNAATIRAGNALGRGDAGHMLRGAQAAVLLGAIGVAISVALFLLLPDQLLGIFIDPEDPLREDILQIGRYLLAMAALFQLVDAAQALHLGLLRGLHDTQIPMVMAALSYWGLGVPAAYLCGFVLGLEGVGVWLGLSIGLASAAVLLGVRFWRLGASDLMQRNG